MMDLVCKIAIPSSLALVLALLTLWLGRLYLNRPYYDVLGDARPCREWD